MRRIAILVFASAASRLFAAAPITTTVYNPMTNRQDMILKIGSVAIGDLGFITQVLDEGVLQGGATWFDFVGAGVTASVTGGTATITITASAGGGASGVAYYNGSSFVSLSTLSAPGILVLSGGGHTTFYFFNSTWNVTTPSTFFSSNTFKGSIVVDGSGTIRGVIISTSDALLGGATIQRNLTVEGLITVSTIVASSSITARAMTTTEFKIEGSTKVGAYRIFDIENGSTFTVTGEGRVGIGTSAPNALLTVAGTGRGSFGGFGALANIHANDERFWNAVFTNGRAGGSKFVANFVGDVGDFFIGNDFDNYIFQVSSENKVGINTIYNGTPLKSMLNVNGNAAFGTYAMTSSAPANGVIVSGNFGVGTDSPTSKVDIDGGSLTVRGNAIVFSTLNVYGLIQSTAGGLLGGTTVHETLRVQGDGETDVTINVTENRVASIRNVMTANTNLSLEGSGDLYLNSDYDNNGTHAIVFGAHGIGSNATENMRITDLGVVSMGTATVTSSGTFKTLTASSFTVVTGTVCIAGNCFLFQSSAPLASTDLVLHLAADGKRLYFGNDNAGSAGAPAGGGSGLSIIDDDGSLDSVSTLSVRGPYGTSDVINDGAGSSTITVIMSTNPYRSVSIPAGSWKGVGRYPAGWLTGGLAVSSSNLAVDGLMFDYLEFSNSSRSFASTQFSMPPNWDGSTVGWRVTVLAGSGTANNNQRWCMDATDISSGTSMVGTFSSSQCVTGTYLAVNQNLQTNLAQLTITGNNGGGGNLTLFRLFRDGNDGRDTHEGFGWLTNVDMFYREERFDGKP